MLAVPPVHLATRVLRPAPIFQIGFNRCGTTSLHMFLTDSGIASAHWRNGALATRMMARIHAGQDPIRDFPGVVGFTDMISIQPGALLEPYKHFDYLHSWYRDALFILNTRDREAWIASRVAHSFKEIRLASRYAETFGIPEAQVPDFWRAEWETHHTRVRAYFGSSSNFLEFHIERDDPRKLRKFIAREYPKCAETPFEDYNRSRDTRAAQVSRIA